MNAEPGNTTFLPVTPEMRHRLAATVEALIALIDEIEGDPEAEPALGAAENHPGGYRGEADQAVWFQPQTHDDREDDGDDLEPSLGGGGTWTDAGLQYDLEEDRSDYEANGDDEPNLGWSETCGQGQMDGAVQSPGSYEGDPCDTGGGALQFNGDGHREAREMLRGRHRRNPDELTIIRPGMARIGF